MEVFDFEDYKKYITNRVSAAAKSGFGQYRRIANHLNIHSSMVSQIINGDKHLTFEQACGVCEYFSLSDLEADYFIALVQRSRAGTPLSRKKCDRDLEKIRSKSQSLKNRLSNDTIISENDIAVLYSHWYYIAIKLISSIPAYDDIQMISECLNISPSVTRHVAEFLTKKGLCILENGKIRPGIKNTHIGADSPMVARHHQNWRLRGFEKMGALMPSELFYTMPVTLSDSDALLIRKKLIEYIEQIVKIVDPSSPETFCCLNLDWFKVC